MSVWCLNLFLWSCFRGWAVRPDAKIPQTLLRYEGSVSAFLSGCCFIVQDNLAISFFLRRLSLLTWNGFSKARSLHLPFDPSHNKLVHLWLTHMWESSHYLVLSWNSRRRGWLPGDFNYNQFSCQAPISLATNILWLTLKSLSQLDTIKLISKSETTVELNKWIQTHWINSDRIVSSFLLNRHQRDFSPAKSLRSTYFVGSGRPWGALWYKGPSFQSQSQTHHSSRGTQLSMWPWSGNPVLSDPPGLPGGCRGRGGASQPSQAKPCLHTSP